MDDFDLPLELIDAARDLGPWTVNDITEYARLYGTNLHPAATHHQIWAELWPTTEAWYLDPTPCRHTGCAICADRPGHGEWGRLQ